MQKKHIKKEIQSQPAYPYRGEKSLEFPILIFRIWNFQFW